MGAPPPPPQQKKQIEIKSVQILGIGIKNGCNISCGAFEHVGQNPFFPFTPFGWNGIEMNRNLDLGILTEVRQYCHNQQLQESRLSLVWEVFH